MYCPKCGKEVELDTMVCPHCGYVINLGTNTNDVFTPKNTTNNRQQSQANQIPQEDFKSTPGFKAKFKVASIFGALSTLLGVASIILFFFMRPGLTDLAIAILVLGVVATTLFFTVVSLGSSLYGSNYRPKGFKENLPIILAIPGVMLGVISAILTFVLYLIQDL